MRQLKLATVLLDTGATVMPLFVQPSRAMLKPIALSTKPALSEDFVWLKHAKPRSIAAKQCPVKIQLARDPHSVILPLVNALRALPPPELLQPLARLEMMTLGSVPQMVPWKDNAPENLALPQ